jgi:hypothetical protein
LSVFLAATAFSDYQVFSGAWFPQLYFFPFAVFTLSTGRFACGRNDSLSALAVSCGFLINGHVSFVSTTAIMLAWAMLKNQVLSRTGSGKSFQSWSSLKFLSQSRTALLRALALFSIFILHIAIETVIHYPGPIAKYISFGAGNPGNPFQEALRFVVSYWGADSFIWSTDVLCVGLIYACLRSDESLSEIKGLFAALVGASIALIFYAMVGVDNLAFKYVGLYYYSVPAFTIATAAYCLYCQIHTDAKRLIAATAIIMAVALCASKIRKPAEYAPQYSEPGIAQLYDKTKALGTLPVVLDLDSSGDWGFVWGHVVGLQAYAERRGVDLLCINRNWHILFTEKGKCTLQQVHDNIRFVVSTSASSSEGDATPAIDFLGLSFNRFEPPLLTVPRNLTIEANRNLFDWYMLGEGWSGIEKEFVWTAGKEAHLFLKVPLTGVKTINLDLAAYLPMENAVQQLEVQADGTMVGSFAFDWGSNKRKRSIHLPAERKNELIDLKLLVSHPTYH